MRFKNVSKMVAVVAMVLFSCGVDAQWQYDTSGGYPYVTYTAKGNPSTYKLFVAKPTDTSKDVDILLQWTWNVTSTLNISESVVCTFPSNKGTYATNGWYIQKVRSGLIDSKGVYVSTKQLTWYAQATSTDNFFVNDTINGPGGTNFNLATYAKKISMVDSSVMELEIALARDEPLNPNTVFSIAQFEYDAVNGQEPAWTGLDFTHFYGYDKLYVQILFYVAGCLNIIPVASLPLMQIPMLLLLAHFIFTPLTMQSSEPYNALFSQNQYFTITMIRNIVGTLFLYAGFTLNWALILIPIIRVVVIVILSFTTFQILQIIPMGLLAFAEVLIIPFIQEDINLYLIGVGYWLFTYLDTPL